MKFKVKTPALRMLKNDVLFQFEDDAAYWRDGKLEHKGFREKTSWGLEIVSPKASSSAPRWVIVFAIGPDVDTDDIDVGSRILVENLKWTTGVRFGDQEYWKTNDEHVIAVDES